MFVRDVGSGPVVVLLHGTPSPAAEWTPVADVLAATHRVLIPELPGYGRSPPLADGSVERVGDALAAMLAERGVDRLCAIVGFSSGAYRALELVLRHAVRCELIVALAGFAAYDDDARAARRGFAATLAADPAALHGDEMTAVLRELMLSPAWRARHPEDAARVVAWADSTTGAALASELAALAASRDLRPELAGLATPVYARVGTEDVGALPAWSEELVRLVPHGELDLVPGCGHALLIEDREATVEAIVARIRRIHDRGAAGAR